MVQGVTPAHKGLAPSRLIIYFSVNKKMPILGTHIIYKIRAKFKAGSKGHFLFAMALDFYKLNKK